MPVLMNASKQREVLMCMRGRISRLFRCLYRRERDFDLGRGVWAEVKTAEDTVEKVSEVGELGGSMGLFFW